MDSKLTIMPVRKQLTLKDYLLDDVCSRSSNSFRSYPRKQCCTTVRFLLDIELKNEKPKPALNGVTTAMPTVVSAFQRVSTAVINAAKYLPLTAIVRSSKEKRSISLSRKLLKRSFWKRAIDGKKAPQWTVYNPLLETETKPSEFVSVTSSLGVDAAGSNTSTSERNSWPGSDFIASDDTLRSPSGSSDAIATETENVVVSEDSLPTKEAVSSKKEAVSCGEDSIIGNCSSASSPNSKKTWPQEEDEQFSPVSVLDRPFDNEDDDVSSPSQQSLAHAQGAMETPKKIKRFVCLKLEPFNLEKRFELSESKSESSDMAENEENNWPEVNAAMLLQRLKATVPSYTLTSKADRLLFDFFCDSCIDRCQPCNGLIIGDRGHDNDALLQVAEDWNDGKSCSFLNEWNVENNRQASIRDMENGEKWKKLDDEIEEVALEVEAEVYSSLLEEFIGASP